MHVSLFKEIHFIRTLATHPKELLKRNNTKNIWLIRMNIILYYSFSFANSNSKLVSMTCQTCEIVSMR